MKKIVILGSSSSGSAAAEQIRKDDKESEITIVSQENYPACRRHLFSDFLAKETDENNVFCKALDFYKENRITTALEKKIAKVDLKKKRVITEEKEQFGYDYLLVTDTPGIRFPEMKGTNKKGVYSLKRFADIKNIVELIPIIETVAIQSNTLAGLKIACALKKREKDVIFATSSDHILSHLLDSEPANIVSGHLEKNGIRIVISNAITEILGNGDVRAVKFNNNKVIAVQAVILDELRPDMKLFAKSELEVNDGMVVNENLRTNLNEVFSSDSACEIKNYDSSEDDLELSLLELDEQGRTVGMNILGQSSAYRKPTRAIELDFSGLSLTLIGQTKMTEGNSKIIHFDNSNDIYRQLIFKEDILVGAVFINEKGQKDKYLRLIDEKSGIASSQKQLFEKLEDLIVEVKEPLPVHQEPQEPQELHEAEKPKEATATEPAEQNGERKQNGIFCFFRRFFKK